MLHSDDYFAPVAFLVIEKCHLEDKEPASSSKLALRLPSSPAQLTLSPAQDDSTGVDTSTQPVAMTLAESAPADRAILPAHGQFRNLFHLSGFMSANSNSLSLEAEIKEVFDHAIATLRQQSMTLDDVCFVHLYVRDMGAFAQINTEYCKYFGQHMPPSRSCVEVSSLPARVLMDCIGIRGSGVSKLQQARVVRDVLHIKSVSAWAPNCIGPYSQANILHKSLILLAGQISLLPQTMELIGADHVTQAKQCFRNAGRVFEALDSNLRHVGSAIVYTTSMRDIKEIAAVCRNQLVTNGGLKDRFEDVVDSDESDDELDKDAERIALVKNAPMLTIHVSHLPRHALIEVELQAFCHRVLKHLNLLSSVFTVPASPSGAEAWKYECQRTIISRALCLVMCTATKTLGSSDELPAAAVTSALDVNRVALGLLKCVEKSLTNAQLPWDRVIHLRVFYQSSAFTSELEIASGTNSVVLYRSQPFSYQH